MDSFVLCILIVLSISIDSKWIGRGGGGRRIHALAESQSVIVLDKYLSRQGSNGSDD